MQVIKRTLNTLGFEIQISQCFYSLKTLQKYEKEIHSWYETFLFSIKFFFFQLNFQAFDIGLKAYWVIFSWKENGLKNLNESLLTK